MANILDVLGPFHILSKFCGFTVFTINRMDLSVKFTLYDFCHFIFSLGFNFFMSINSVKFFVNMPQTQGSRITIYSIPILAILTMIVQFGNCCSQIFLRYKIVEILKNFIEIDLKVSRFYTNYPK